MPGLAVRVMVWGCILSAMSIGYLDWRAAGWPDSMMPSEPPPLTLEHAYQLALHRNLTIQAAKTSLQEAKADITIAGLRPNPSLHTDVSSTEETYRVAGIEQRFEVPGKRRLRIKIAKQYAEITQSQYQQVVRQILLQVRQAYIHWISALIGADMQTKNLRVVNTLKNTTDARFQAGHADALDVSQATLLLHQTRNDHLQAQSQVRQTQANLSGLLNLKDITPPPHPGMTVASVSTLPPLPVVLQESLKNRPDLQTRQKALEAQRNQIRLLRLNRIPDLTLQAGYDIVVTSRTRHGYYVTGSIEIPLFDHQQGNLAKAKAIYQRMRTEQALLTQQAQTDVTVNYDKLALQQAEWKQYVQHILPEAEALEALAQQQYQAGKIDLGNTLRIHQNVVTTRQQALTIFAEYQESSNAWP